MIRSMTGYGRGEAVFPERTVVVEVRSVNSRYLDCGVKLPRSCLFAEDAIRKRVQSQVSRGKTDVFVSVTGAGGEAVNVTVNEPLARGYKRALDALAKKTELDNAAAIGSSKNMMVQLYLIARFPDVLTVEQAAEDRDAVTAQLLAALDLALAGLNEMREREGRRLAEDILNRAETIETLVGLVEERSPETVRDYRARLEAKMAEVLQNTQLDEARILTEAALFADRVAVDEETVRLRSHIAQLREMLARGSAIGRKLDFLVQEFNREANTIGSKCNDAEITRHVVDMKAEIEKIREQVQNLE